MEDAADPDFPPERLASSLLDLFRDQHVPGELAFLIARKGSPDRARAVAQAALDFEPRSLAALTFAATVAEALQDDEACVEHYRHAVEVSPDPETRWCHAAALQAAGRNAEALEALEELSREDPTDWGTNALHADGLREARRRMVELEAGAGCPCGRSESYVACCLPREKAVLARFADRGPFDELRRAVWEYAAKPDLARLLESAKKRWLRARLAAEVEGDEGEMRLFGEWSWTAIDPRETPEEDEGADDCILRRFSEDPAIPAPLRRQARRWLKDVRWGLWLIADPTPDPGVRLVDLLTGTTLYAALPTEQLESFGPWTAILGALVPVDGVWRTAGAVIPMPPSAADRLTDMIIDLAQAVARKAMGKALPPYDPYDGLPASAAAQRMGRAPEDICSFFGKVVSAGMPGLVTQLQEWASALPELRNTDKHPLLLIKADIAVRDTDRVRRDLAEHPDLTMVDGELVWMGKQMTRAQIEVSLAEARNFVKEEGVHDAEIKSSQRWTRGQVTITSSGVTLDTNSVERLEMFLELLETLGAEPTVVSRSTVDPKQELVLGAAGARPDAEHAGGLSAEAREAWERTWIDEPLPGLEGMTPRQAARDDRGSILLEAMLRDMEHRAAANQALGAGSFDIQRIRASLETAAADPEAAPGPDSPPRQSGFVATSR